jgi:hypothetical protein
MDAAPPVVTSDPQDLWVIDKATGQPVKVTVHPKEAPTPPPAAEDVSHEFDDLNPEDMVLVSQQGFTVKVKARHRQPHPGLLVVDVTAALVDRTTGKALEFSDGSRFVVQGPGHGRLVQHFGHEPGAGEAAPSMAEVIHEARLHVVADLDRHLAALQEVTAAKGVGPHPDAEGEASLAQRTAAAVLPLLKRSRRAARRKASAPGRVSVARG